MPNNSLYCIILITVYNLHKQSSFKLRVTEFMSDSLYKHFALNHFALINEQCLAIWSVRITSLSLSEKIKCSSDNNYFHGKDIHFKMNFSSTFFIWIIFSSFKLLGKITVEIRVSYSYFYNIKHWMRCYQKNRYTFKRKSSIDNEIVSLWNIQELLEEHGQ